MGLSGVGLRIKMLAAFSLELLLYWICPFLQAFLWDVGRKVVLSHILGPSRSFHCAFLAVGLLSLGFGLLIQSGLGPQISGPTMCSSGTLMVAPEVYKPWVGGFSNRCGTKGVKPQRRWKSQKDHTRGRGQNREGLAPQSGQKLLNGELCTHSFTLVNFGLCKLKFFCIF